MARDQLFYFRDCLLPLMSLEEQLTNSISGMVRAVGGTYIRSDWQASYPRERDPYGRVIQTQPTSNGRVDRRDVDCIYNVQRSLSSYREYIRDLWRHPYLPTLMKARRIKVEDSTSL